MTVTNAWLAGLMIEAFETTKLHPEVCRKLLQGICLNSTGSVSYPKDGKEPVVSGSPTESAVLTWGLQLGMNYNQIKHEATILHVETFNSTKKRAAVVFETKDGDVHVHWKGAAEIILGSCSKWMDSEKVVDMTPEKEDELRRTIEGMAALKLRCIAFAYRVVEKSEIPIGEEAWANWQTPENDLILLGIAGIKVSFSHQIKMPAFMPNIHIIDALGLSPVTWTVSESHTLFIP
jgi:Ca2+-transporting ATPase